MIIARINNQDYLGFSRMGLKKEITTICDQFTITCTADNRFAFPIPRGAAAEFEIDGQKEFTGFVEQIRSRYSSSKYSVSAMGRDSTKLIVKTDLKPSFSLKGPISLLNAMKKTLKAHDIDVDVTNVAGSLPDLSDREVLTGDVGEKIWEFFNSMATKIQVLITKDNDGNLVIFRPGQFKYNMILRSQLEEVQAQNNIVEADFDFDDSERVGKIVVMSQANLTVPGSESPPDPETGEVVAEALVKRSKTSGEAIDEAITDGSVRYIVAEHPSDNKECERQAKWHLNNQRAKATSYTCSEASLTIDGAPWQTGYLIDVIDEIADINAEMLITAVEFDTEKDEKGRAVEQVNLTLTVPDAFSEVAGATAANKQNNKIGSNWNEGDFQ